MQVDEYMALPKDEREHYLERLEPPELLQLGVNLFNAGHFWHSHEAWEEAWVPSEQPVRSFYQGLIQVAAAFVHLTRNEYPGTVKLLEEGLSKLVSYRPDYLGIDVEGLISEARQTQARVVKDGPRGLSNIAIASLPRITTLR